MNDVTPFAYGDHPVRTLTIDGEPWFVLSDYEILREPRVDLNEMDAHMSRNLWSKP